MTIAAMAGRFGYDGDDPANLIAVVLTFARHAFAARGLDLPVETLRGHGYRWALDATPGAKVRVGRPA